MLRKNEHLSEGRGFPIPAEYTHIDPFCNSWRYWMDKEKAIETLVGLYKGELAWDKEAALKYIAGRKWENTIVQVDRVLREWENEKS